MTCFSLSPSFSGVYNWPRVLTEGEEIGERKAKETCQPLTQEVCSLFSFEEMDNTESCTSLSLFFLLPSLLSFLSMSITAGQLQSKPK